MTSPATLRVQRPSLPNDPIPPAQTRGPSQAAPDQAKTWLRSPSSPHEHAVVHADRPNKKTSGMHRIAKQSATILVYMAHNDSGHGLLQQPLPPPPNAHHRSPAKRICVTGFVPLADSRFSQSRTSIQRTSPSELRMTSMTGKACSIQCRTWPD